MEKISLNDDRNIVRNLKSDDDHTRDFAVKLLFNKYKDYLYSRAFTRVKDEHTAQTLVNDTFLTVLDKIDQFNFQPDNPSSFRGWLFSVLLNKIRDFHRKNQREKEKIELSRYDETAFDDNEALPSKTEIQVQKKITNDFFAEDDTRKNPQIEKVAEFLQSLSDRDRIILIGCASGLAQKEVAEYAQVNVNQVKVYNYRLKERLKNYLETN